jgi:hypothetical protein
VRSGDICRSEISSFWRTEVFHFSPGGLDSARPSLANSQNEVSRYGLPKADALDPLRAATQYNRSRDLPVFRLRLREKMG